MTSILTEEQESIRRSAKQLVSERAPISAFRALRDGADATGYSLELLASMVDLGFSGMTLPARFGGMEMGFSELGLVLEECGRKLVASPIVSNLLLGGLALQLGSNEAQKERWLPAVAAGKAVVALAHEEGTRHAPYAVATRAERASGGYRVSGTKTMVVDGHVADAFVVTARTSGQGKEGIALFVVPRGAPGVEASRRSLVDSRNVATVHFDGVAVGEDALVGGVDVFERVLDRAAIGLSAEMLGGVEEALEQTIAYLKVRKQFGVPIGSFQALKHRAAHLFCEKELLRSLVMEALRAVDEDRADVPSLASATKARASDVFVLTASEAIQMHGGIGVTDDLDIGFFLKRARVTEMMLGTAAFHRDRFATLSGH